MMNSRRVGAGAISRNRWSYPVIVGLQREYFPDDLYDAIEEAVVAVAWVVWTPKCGCGSKRN